MYRVGAESPNFINECDTIAPSWEGGPPPVPANLYTPEELEADNERLFYTSENLPIDSGDLDPGTPLQALEERDLSTYHTLPPVEERPNDPNQLTLTTFEQVVTVRHAIITTKDAEHPLAADHLEGERGRYSLLDALRGVDSEGHLEYTVFGEDADLVRDALRTAADRYTPITEEHQVVPSDPQAHFDAAAAKLVEELHIPTEEPRARFDTLTHRIRPLVRRTLAFMLVS